MRQFDVAVIGAGIQGAGIAQAAAARGWSVVVLEQYPEPAMGTSSKSSKLIHGGLRYLESYQFGLVRECLEERKILLSVAPGLVTSNRFVIPVYKHFKRNAWTIRFGLLLYAFLSGRLYEGVCDFGRALSKSRVLDEQGESFKHLKKTDLVALLEYEDAQTDDKLLTEAVLASASDLDAEVLYSTKVSGIQSKTNIQEITLQNGEKLCSRVVINAAGPWANELAKMVSPAVPIVDIELVRGTHIVLDIEAPEKCFYLESPDDGRALFALPWYGRTLVGTTEKVFVGEPEASAATQEEMSYLLKAFQHYFPELSASEGSIIESFSGLRVLPTGKGSLNQRTRETVIFNSSSHPNYFAVYGGKLTSYRSTACKVIKKIENKLPVRDRRADTSKILLKVPARRD